MDDIQPFHVLFSGVGDLFFCGSTSVPRSEDFTESESDFDEQGTLSYFRQDARFTFYTLKDGRFVAYKK